MTKGIAGAQIIYTKIVLGDGTMAEGQTTKGMTAVINPVITVDITKCEPSGAASVIVGGAFSNENLLTGFYFRELGLYAQDPDAGEILYSYGNAGSTAEWIPPSEQDLIEKTIDIITFVGAAANFTANIPSGVYVTQEQLDAIKSVSEAALAAANSNATLLTQLSSKVETMWNAVYLDITTNPWSLTFSNLDGVTVLSGIWNEAFQRLDC